MLLLHPESGLFCPVITRLGSWHARQIWLLEPSRTRKSWAIVSMDCACGLWQLMHSTFPLIRRTLCNGSAVVPCATKQAAKSAVSLIGVTRLNGWELVRSVPKVSPGVQLPTVVT